MITINSNTRYFNVPGADLVFGVVADSDAERKFFQCPRYVGDNLDLASCFIRINYRNANGKTDFYLVDDMVIDGDNITFSWLLSPKVTEYRGQIKFVMCAVGPDLKLKWHTTQGTGQVMEGLEPDNSHVESQTADVVAQLIAMVEKQTSTVEKVGTEQVASVRSAAETARMAAVNEIEAKRANSLASIPNDYTALSGAVESLGRDRAGGIVCSAEGEVITLNDASDNPLRGMRIFGRSTQDGTPTPENPVEIVSLGAGGSVGAIIDGLNLFNLNSGIISGTSKTVTFIDNGFVLDASSQNTRICRFKCNLKKGNTYFLSYDTKNVVGVGEAKPFIPTIEQYLVVNKPFTPEADADEIGIYINGASIPTVAEITNIQVSLTNEKKDYEPFTEQSATIAIPNGLHGIPVTSGGNYTDASGQQWICDEIDMMQGKLIRRVYAETISGKRTFIETTDHAGRFVCPGFVSVDYKGGAENALANFATWGEWGVGKQGVSCFAVNKRSLYFYPETATTADEVTALFAEMIASETPPVIMAQLETPIETPLSEAELSAYRALHTNKPNTTILNDSGAYMSVDYTADTKLYIDNKIKEVLQC